MMHLQFSAGKNIGMDIERFSRLINDNDNQKNYSFEGEKLELVQIIWTSNFIDFLPRASAAVILFLGSTVNIFLTRSFALGEMESHGALCKSSLASETALKISFSVSNTFVYQHITTI